MDLKTLEIHFNPMFMTFHASNAQINKFCDHDYISPTCHHSCKCLCLYMQLSLGKMNLSQICDYNLQSL